MSKLPRNVKGKQLITALEKSGFKLLVKEAVTLGYLIPMEDGHKLQYIQNQFPKVH